MVDYAKLAEKAKALQDAAKNSTARPVGAGHDPVAFYNAVKAHLNAEFDKANAELGKRGVPVFDRTFSPGFTGKFTFTYGTSALCSVSLDAQPGLCRVIAALTGPPRGQETNHREYVFNTGASQPKTVEPGEGEGGVTTVTGLKPAEIAEDIISSILMGEFV